MLFVKTVRFYDCQDANFLHFYEYYRLKKILKQIGVNRFNSKDFVLWVTQIVEYCHLEHTLDVFGMESKSLALHWSPISLFKYSYRPVFKLQAFDWNSFWLFEQLFQGAQFAVKVQPRLSELRQSRSLVCPIRAQKHTFQNFLVYLLLWKPQFLQKDRLVQFNRGCLWKRRHLVVHCIQKSFRPFLTWSWTFGK